MNNLHKIGPQKEYSDITLSWLWWWTTQNPHRVRLLVDRDGVEIYLNFAQAWEKRTNYDSMVIKGWEQAGRPTPDWSKVS